MKVYVDENEDYRITYSSRDGSECLESVGMQPIIVESLADYTKQVRKEVIKEIKENMNKFGRKNIYNNNGDVVGVLEALSLNEIINILDQLQGEDNGN